jgi:hypothetical protein
MAYSVIRKAQTTFLPGRNILEGVVVLHETLHEMRRKKKKRIIMKLDFEKAYDKVVWRFLIEVLERKKFPVKWIEWVQQAVTEGVGINLNGEPGNFFRTFKGLRQGDPLSPLLFNLVADALATLMEKAKDVGLIKGLVPELVKGGLTHLQYADDTMICLETNEESIVNTKFILYCFENMSGMKINYHKSEVTVLGVSNKGSARIAKLFNCREGSLPMKYLDVLVSNMKLYGADLIYVGVKVDKRLPAWQGLHLSSRGCCFDGK